MSSAYHIRPEVPEDQPGVYRVNASAFGKPAEADLVDQLRANLPTAISLIAEVEGKIVGHIFFSPVSIEPGGNIPGAVALGPMAVAPEYQGRGIGSALVRQGVAACMAAGHTMIFVLGHPWFYPKFGFVPAATYGFECQWDVEDPYFMGLELVEGAASGWHGLVKYPPEFSAD